MSTVAVTAFRIIVITKLSWLWPQEKKTRRPIAYFEIISLLSSPAIRGYCRPQKKKHKEQKDYILGSICS